jgi:glycosyltransferase involved in cell wall biosynthesis
MAKKIGIEAQRLFRTNKHGVEVVCLELLREIQQIQTTNEYVVFVKDDLDHCLDSNSFCQVKLLPPRPFPIWEQYLLPAEARKLGLNLLHCTGNTAPIKHDMPLLLTLHDIIFFEDKSFSGTAYQNWGNLYRRWIVPRVIPKCQSILTVSHFEKQRIMDFFKLPDDLVNVIYNGVSREFKPQPKEAAELIRKKYDLPESFILFFGNKHPKKNTAGVLKSYKRYLEDQGENAIPIVITDCERSYVEGLLRGMNLKNAERNILTRPYIPYKDMPSLYNLATLFLYPSLREAFGLPILESMACGTPVITATNSSMPEIAGDAAVLADANDHLEIADAIERLLGNRELFESKKAQGIIRAERFNWNSTAHEVIAQYERLTG